MPESICNGILCLVNPIIETKFDVSEIFDGTLLQGA